MPLTLEQLREELYEFLPDAIYPQHQKQLIADWLLEAITTHIQSIREAIEGEKKAVKDLFPKATLSPLDEDTAFQIHYKDGFNAGLDAAKALLEAKK